MFSIPSSYNNVQDCQAYFTAQLSKAEQRIKLLEAENRQLRAQQAWENKLFANPYLSSSHKLTLRETVNTIRKAQKNDTNGLTKIFIPALAQKIGVSAKTMGKNLKYLSDTGTITRQEETKTDDTGKRITRIFVGLLDPVKSPDKIQPPVPRNHGGKRQYCPSCGSEDLLEEKKIICTDCGEVIQTTHRLVNPDDPTGGQDESRNSRGEVAALEASNICSGSPPTSIPADNSSAFIKPKEPGDKMTSGAPEKPAKPQDAMINDDVSQAGHVYDDHKDDGNITPGTLAEDTLATDGKPAGRSFSGPGAVSNGVYIQGIGMYMYDDANDMYAIDVDESLLQTAAADLLLDIAGDANEHIVMSRGDKKYITVHRSLTLGDIHAHLKGTTTIGATLKHTDGMTRALCFDVDDEAAWRQLQEASLLLIAQGYKPILEPSPAKRGGHLWLIFTGRVDASAAHTKVCEIAPLLKTVREYWPRFINQKVRLPGGMYLSKTTTAWCHLLDSEQNILRVTAALLLHQTPGELIPSLPPLEESPVNTKPGSTPQVRVTKNTKEADQVWQQKYGKSNLWFAFDAKQLIAWYNNRTQVTDLLSPERSGFGLAHWRGERTASVAYTKDGIGWVDFGAAARRSDGKCDGGDSLELSSRIEQLPKSDLMKEAASALLKEARSALESAAALGEPLPGWLDPLVTPAGLRHYQKLRKQAEKARGVAGYIASDKPPYPPPTRACMSCGVAAWKWTGEGYVCSHPNHPKNTSN